MSTLLSLTRRVSYLFPGTSKTAFCYLFLWICFKCACWLLPVLLIKRFYICYHQIVALKYTPHPCAKVIVTDTFIVTSLSEKVKRSCRSACFLTFWAKLFMCYILPGCKLIKQILCKFRYLDEKPVTTGWELRQGYFIFFTFLLSPAA